MRGLGVEGQIIAKASQITCQAQDPCSKAKTLHRSQIGPFSFLHQKVHRASHDRRLLFLHSDVLP
jgi:hypothetical protein